MDKNILTAKFPDLQYDAMVYPEGGAWYSEVIVGMATNVVTLNHKGVTICNNSKQLLEASSLVD